MNISDPNLLGIIAKHISDKQTFANFARLSKICSQIARKLTPIKKFEFKYIKFELVYSKLANHCIWDGQYTKGIKSHRDTRVWFYPCGLEVVYDGEILMKDYNDKFEIYDYHIDNDHLLGDFCQLRESYINLIIDGLKNKRRDVCYFIPKPENITDREINKKILKATLVYDYHYIKRELELDEFIDTIINQTLIVRYDQNYKEATHILTIWIVRDLQAVIEELHKVRLFCFKNEILSDSDSFETETDEE